ncbi:hypothetical protein D3C78_1666940 [compost metagenome]
MAFGVHPVLDIVAGERKLAAVAPVLVLINDAADGFRISGVAHAVEDDLCHGCLSLHRFSARLEIDA